MVKKLTAPMVILFFLAGCTLKNPLIGEWNVYKMESPDGNVIDLPETYVLREVFFADYYVVYKPKKEPIRYSYSLHRDIKGLFIKGEENGVPYGARFTLIDTNTLRWDLFEKGSMRPMKMWMKKEENLSKD
jgi:hypothetical protein